MSYAQFGAESSVWVYLDTDGHLRCDLCGLPEADAGVFRAADTEAMVAHLERHTAIGHTIPPGLEAALRADNHQLTDARGAWLPPVIGRHRDGKGT